VGNLTAVARHGSSSGSSGSGAPQATWEVQLPLVSVTSVLLKGVLVYTASSGASAWGGLGAAPALDSGAVHNLHAVDTAALERGPDALLTLALQPLEILGILLLLVWFVGGPAAGGAVACVLFNLALTVASGLAAQALDGDRTAAADRRVRALSEFLTGMRAVKLLGWEARFAAAIAAARSAESASATRTSSGAHPAAAVLRTSATGSASQPSAHGVTTEYTESGSKMAPNVPVAAASARRERHERGGTQSRSSTSAGRYASRVDGDSAARNAPALRSSASRTSGAGSPR
jgi:hypothetical protein